MKVKKGIALLVAFLMLVSNTGFAMTVHYCGGKISSISSGISNKETCEMPKAEAEKACCTKKIEVSHKKCCSDKTVNVKGKAIDIIVKMASADYAIPFVMPVQKPLVFDYAPSVAFQKTPLYYCDAHAPPLFKLYQQYIFYA
jgi:hypothetical protein